MLEACPATATHSRPAGSAPLWTASEDKRLIEFMAGNPDRSRDIWPRARDHVGRACGADRVRQRWSKLCARGIPRAVARPRGRPIGSGKLVPDIILAELRHCSRAQVARRYGVTRKGIDYIVTVYGGTVKALPKGRVLDAADIALAEQAWADFEKSHRLQ